MTSALFSLLLIFSAAVAGPLESPSKEVALGEPFEIRIGQQVSIKKESLKISFTSVAEDSRCPEGVQCIWAGNGKIVLRLNKARRGASVMRLNTTVEPKEDDYRGYDVKLVSLSPYPQKDVPIRRKEYVATLVASRK